MKLAWTFALAGLYARSAWRCSVFSAPVLSLTALTRCAAKHSKSDEFVAAADELCVVCYALITPDRLVFERPTSLLYITTNTDC